MIILLVSCIVYKISKDVPPILAYLTILEIAIEFWTLILWSIGLLIGLMV
jgi:hypothetical protein